MSNPEAAAPLQEARFYLRREMSQPERLLLAGGEVVVFTRARQPGLAPNEDAAGVIPIGEHGVVLLLADGMGGTAAGARAASIAVTRTAERLLPPGEGRSAVRNAILDGIEDANHAIRGLEVGAGTTVLVLEIASGSFRSYHAGDSMALLVDVDGRPTWRTPPHSPVGYAIEAGLLDENDAMTHKDRHLLANALGKRTMHIEVAVARPLQPGDTLILASDGLFDNLTLEEIGQRVRGGGLPSIVDDLVMTAARRMDSPDTSSLSKPDDLTVVAYRERAPEALGTLEFSPAEFR